MQGRILHLHEPRLGIGLPRKTVRPWGRSGDALLSGFLTALAEPVDRLVLTGRLFMRPEPAAQLADRVAAPLGELVRAGTPVMVPPGTPCALLFLAAGASLTSPVLPEEPPEFWRSGAYRLLEGDRIRTRKVRLPGAVEVTFDVTGRYVADALASIRDLLETQTHSRFVRLVLTGISDEPELLSLGPRGLRALLPGALEGAIVNRVEPDRPRAVIPRDDEERQRRLSRVRARLPDLPVAPGVYEFLDERGRVLYVGKAVDLRRRVASHFTAEAREPSPRGPMLMATRALRIRRTEGELMALLTEARRIRETRPPYNRQMKERESYRYLRVDLEGPLPSITSRATAGVEGDVRFYGPFTKRWVVERALRVLQVTYGLHSCAWRPGETAPPVCTDRDHALCAAPCTGRITPDGYRRRIRMAIDDLHGASGCAPAFGDLNSPSAGLLGPDDLRILDGFRRSFRYLMDNLANANGTIELPTGHLLLVLGGLRAGERPTDRDTAAWIAREHARFAQTPARTWVTPEEADEVRILSFWLRKKGTPLRGVVST